MRTRSCAGEEASRVVAAFLARSGAVCLALLCLQSLSGCGLSSTVHGNGIQPKSLSGALHGGQQPISGATVQLYAVSVAGDGAVSTPLLQTTVQTNQQGTFSAGAFTCPTPTSLVYLVSTGGNPGLPAGIQNKAAGLMAALGPCSVAQSIPFVNMNELTTVVSVMPLAPLMSSYAAIGASPGHMDELANGFNVANQLVAMTTGTMPGSALPVGSSIPASEIDTLANVIAACINSAGGVSGDGTPCGELFFYAEAVGSPPPTNVLDALMNIAKQPSANVTNIFNLAPADAVYEPGLTVAPNSWSATVSSPAPFTSQNFLLAGLTTPATVAESIFVFAPISAGADTVAYYVDDHVVSTETVAPYWMGGRSTAGPYGFSIAGLAVGSHTLRAVATLPDGSLMASNPIALQVVLSINSTLSDSLTPYGNQLSAQQNNPDAILAKTTTAGASMTANELQARREVLAMYLNWGLDPSLDNSNDQSALLVSLFPSGWVSANPVTSDTSLSMLFSSDAPFYQSIPASWPRIALPSAYIKQVQLNTSPDGDGIGYGEVVGTQSSPALPVRSEWYSNASTLKDFLYRMPGTWPASLPANPAGDSHMIFVDRNSETFVSSYKTTDDPVTGGPDALYASSPTPLGTLGDSGGSTASAFAELPVLLQPGEATNSGVPIPHALGGPVGRTWAARVYPASAWDADVLTSTNTCTGTGFTNTGLVPYGGVIQLDPALDLTSLKLSLPAHRILEAIQSYGYYVMDFGCADLDIYTATSAAEFAPYGGVWGNQFGPGVQNEIQAVLAANTLYVIVPLTKKE